MGVLELANLNHATVNDAAESRHTHPLMFGGMFEMGADSNH